MKVIYLESRRGMHFKVGEAIISGSYCGIVEVGFDTPATVDYEGIGRYQITFTEKNYPL
ncbi:hypothetical protein ACP43V_18670 [Vibrio genomosp. F10 str. 9ZC157]|uniref:hypothetical protein n=1 Tax=Vibrio genomosp. F10 TaxID=723171 RepID=UPI0003682C75|nr:hypothetical protein [Vibrio genomosp. F10]